MTSPRRLRVISLALVLSVSTVIAEDAGTTTLHLKLAGSAGFGAGADVPVGDAVLFLDSTNFDGKSGVVRLQKGMTVAWLVITSRAISGTTEGTFEKKSFLQRNVTPLPKLPALTAPEDYTVVIGVSDIFDPRRQATSTLQQAMARQPITKLTSMAPWISAVEIPSVIIETIHLHVVDAVVHAPSLPGKFLSNHAPAFRSGGTVIAYGPGVSELHLQCFQKRAPFDSAPVVLRREGKDWTATLDLKSKEIAIRGTVPVRLMPPVARTINEYADRK